MCLFYKWFFIPYQFQDCSRSRELYQWMKQTGSFGTLYTITKTNKWITCCLEVFFGGGGKGSFHWWAWIFFQLILYLYNYLTILKCSIPWHLVCFQCHIIATSVSKTFSHPKRNLYPLSRSCSSYCGGDQAAPSQWTPLIWIPLMCRFMESEILCVLCIIPGMAVSCSIMH